MHARVLQLKAAESSASADARLDFEDLLVQQLH